MNAAPSCAGKVVLVTGAQRGIGRAIALRFAAAGADVALNFLDDEPAATSAAAEIAALGRRAVTLGADVARAEQARRLVADAERALGPLDVLVNNAAIFPRAPFLELAEATWDAVLDTNLKATFVCSQEAARRMVAAKRPGTIVNLASGAPYRGSMRATAYMASKLGIVGLTRGMARELAPHGIRVNAIAPGIVNTAMPRLGNTEDALAALARANPSGRLGEPDDIADVVVFLATDAARYLVGQVIHVNGGDYHG
ncbi:MAG TPA: 3-oxoacyl-ACP reductase family protein [Methylomirabilota bacterium]|nr:3-oxoacyl-ACP reductase family protein [Methylomirabilota bacterium]